MNRLKTTIFLVDNHEMVRSPLAAVLGQEDGFEIVGTAGCADDALPRIRALQPDIVLMDIDMPGMDSFEAARLIRFEFPSTHVIFLSAYYHDSFIDQALKAEARGYVTKDESPQCIINAIREVIAGGAYFSEQVRSRILIDGHSASLSSAVMSRSASLTPREREILRHVAQGLTNKEISTLLNIADKTVDNHTTNLRNKLDLHSKAELIRFAIREGLITL